MNERLPLAVVLVRQRECWQRGERLLVEDLLAAHPHLAADENAVLDLIYGERVLREEAGRPASLGEYLGGFPALAAALRVMFEVHDALAPEHLGPDAAPTVRTQAQSSSPLDDAPRLE